MPETAAAPFINRADLLSEVQLFLHEPLGLFINGSFRPARAHQVMETVDPATGTTLATVARSQAADVDDAVNAASAAFADSGWATMKPADRSVVLHRLADLIDQHSAAIAQLESLDVGKPIAQPNAFDVPHVAKTLRYYADLAAGFRYSEPIQVAEADAYTLRKPYGVCGFILPWNFPFLLLGWNISPALAAGNTVVIKPSEETPLTALYFAKLAIEAGVPAGVVNVVTGAGEEAGAALSQHPGLARIAFTGSPEVGRMVAEAAGQRLIPCKLELGGKGAAVIFDDVDPANVAEQLSNAITLNSGQVCCTATRWFIHDDIYDRFVAAASRHLTSIRTGAQMDDKTQMGPVVSAKQRERILGYLKRGLREGATLVLGSTEEKEGDGYFVDPALLTGEPENICAREEIFGPVAYLIRFKTEKEAITMVNSSRYGLANSVWSGDLDRARRVSESLIAGNSWINAHNVFVHGIPYGGINLSGLGGGVLGKETFTDYLRAQSVVRPK